MILKNLQFKKRPSKKQRSFKNLRLKIKTRVISENITKPVWLIGKKLEKI